MTREEFCRRFKAAAEAKGLSQLELARKFQTSYPTIERWLNGEAAPHEVGRESILAALETNAPR